jgi:uncharacterized protein
MKITATQFYEYCKCPRKVYNHFHEDHSLKLPVSDFMQYLFDRGKEHEDVVVSKLKFAMPSPKLSNKQAFLKTIEFMKNGEPIIYQGVLIHDNLIGKPDLLIKQKGKRSFGDYYYVPADIKTGLNLKKEYAMQIVFYAYLLEKIQGFMPLEAKLIKGDFSEDKFKVQDYYNDFSEILFDIKKIIQGKKIKPHIFSECKECPWHDFCFDWALKSKDISLIYNLSRSKEEVLVNFGVDTINKAADMNIDELSKVKGLGITSLTKWKNQAKSLQQKKIIKINNYEFPSAKPIYFDIEADTELDVVYLFGIIEDGKYINFFADKLKDEKRIWIEFLSYFKDKEDFKIYHYGNYEKIVLKKLFEKYKGDKKIYEKIMNNLTDLHKILLQTRVLPIYSYSIKEVAPYFGFKWSEEEIGGGLAMLWYSRYLKGDNEFKNKILQYNKEDCEAMILVKEKIEEK